MLRSLSCIGKAALAVCATPVTVIADIVTLPASADRGAGPFDKTGSMVRRARDCFAAATCPHTDVDAGELVDMGRTKLYTCLRCGHRFTV